VPASFGFCLKAAKCIDLFPDEHCTSTSGVPPGQTPFVEVRLVDGALHPNPRARATPMM